MLKGRFFQALHAKWQRKLGAPKITESFNELYDRACTLERQERQISANAAARGETKVSAGKPHNKQSNYSNRQPTKQSKVETMMPAGSNKSHRQKTPVHFQTQQQQQTGSDQQKRGCWICGKLTHLARNCKESHLEASGRSGRASRTAHLTAAPQPVNVEDLTEEQLEKLLNQRRLSKEKDLLTQSTVSSVNTITAKPMVGDAVGPTLYCDLKIEGVATEAMVDTGSQSTIISRALLHRIAKNLEAQQRPLPELELPNS